VETVITRIQTVEPSAAPVLLDVAIEIVDLDGDLLGLTVGDTIQIDVDAAGFGWFIDTTPWDDAEFGPPTGAYELTALPGSAAADRADLFTVVFHELGHVLGYGHEDDGLMQDTLPLGTRRLGDFDTSLDKAIDAVFASESIG